MKERERERERERGGGGGVIDISTKRFNSVYTQYPVCHFTCILQTFSPASPPLMYYLSHRKFDIGLYTVITSVNPLRVYIYEEEILLRWVWFSM